MTFFDGSYEGLARGSVVLSTAALRMDGGEEDLPVAVGGVAVRRRLAAGGPARRAACVDGLVSDGTPQAGPPPTPLAPPALMIDTEAVQQVFTILGEQLQALTDAMRPFVQQMMRDLAAVGRAFAALAATPGMQELADARRRARSRMKSNYARRRGRRVKRE
ncbi:hypothetical protein [Nonomuraea angiospora]|uniref:hypothetical protein n=1 Tax=Nonomuraea angiospora TaxID=46172 RepID=UPI0029A140EB|nr:hypothetical protein [Nonomuraea angiospora]MDX3100467.1 hypothetical protein [Nonomuraea angiospora]